MTARRSANEIGSSFKETTSSRMGTVSESGAITSALTGLMRRHLAELQTGQNAFARMNPVVQHVKVSGIMLVRMHAHLVNRKSHAIDL